MVEWWLRNAARSQYSTRVNCSKCAVTPNATTPPRHAPGDHYEFMTERSEPFFFTTLFPGLPLTLGDAPEQRVLTTQPLSMSVSSVVSELAQNATGGMWSATDGMPTDKLPEVPPDGTYVYRCCLGPD